MSSNKIVSDLQKVNPSAVIELFTLTLDNSLHGATTTYRFHAGTSLKDNGEIIWQGNTVIQDFLFRQKVFNMEKANCHARQLVLFQMLLEHFQQYFSQLTQ